MTKRQIQKSTLSAGRDIAAKGKEVGKEELSTESLTAIFQQNVPKGITIPHVTDSQDVAEAFLKKENVLSESEIKNIFQGAVAFVAHSKKRTDLFYIPKGLKLQEQVVAGTHEFRHLLDENTTVLCKIAKMIRKFLPDKFFGKKYKEFTSLVMNIYKKLQEAAVNDTKIFSPQEFVDAKSFYAHIKCKPEEFRAYIDSLIRQDLTPENYSKNIKLLKKELKQIQKEVDAYAVGGKIGRYIEPNAPEGLHGSEIIAEYQRELLKAIKQELKIQRLAYYKKMIGVTVPKIDQSVVESPCKAPNPFAQLFKFKDNAEKFKSLVEALNDNIQVK